MHYSDEQTFLVPGRLVLRRIGEDRLLVPVSGDLAVTNAVFPVNETGTVIWEAVSAGKTLAQAASEVSRQFAVAYETALADSDAFVARLVEGGLMVTA